MDEILVARLRQHDSNTADRNELGMFPSQVGKGMLRQCSRGSRMRDSGAAISSVLALGQQELTEWLEEAEPLRSSLDGVVYYVPVEEI
jgi:hypothetical protein